MDRQPCRPGASVGPLWAPTWGFLPCLLKNKNVLPQVAKSELLVVKGQSKDLIRLKTQQSGLFTGNRF